MDEKGYLKRSLLILFVSLIVLSVVVYAIKNIKTGQCVQDCTHVYNPTFADYKNKTQYPIEGFIANVCVQACKDNSYQGACSEQPGDCCNIFREDIDADCQGIDYCREQSDCKNPNYFYCDIPEQNPTCKPKLVYGITCEESYQCLDGTCQLNNPDHPEYGSVCK